MNLLTFCHELTQRIPGCLNISVYDFDGNDILNSNYYEEKQLNYLFEQEKVCDEISKMGLGEHNATTIVEENFTIIIIKCNKLKLFLKMDKNSNIGLVYSLMSSIQETFASISI